MLGRLPFVTALVACAALLLGSCTSQPVAPASVTARASATILMGVGHLNRDGKPFHYWDKEKEIPAVCARCHAANGVPQYLAEGKNTPAPHVRSAFACTNCHADMSTYARHKVAKVTFPSGVTVDSGDADSNLCMTCHQGRESTASVNKAIADRPLDVADPKLAFVHVHYLPAGATQFGTVAKVAYEYAGKAYAGRFAHPAPLDTCTSCHEAHTGELKADKCSACHLNTKPGAASALRIEQQKAALYAAIQDYARNVGGASIAFTPAAYPYWYTDTNGNGAIDADELKPTNGYSAYTPRLLQAVYNYTFAVREPGAAYHNSRYAGQVLHDSLQSLAESGRAKVQMAGVPRP